MHVNLAPLAQTVAQLRSGRRDLVAYVNAMCDRVDRVDAEIHALLPEPDRRERLRAEAASGGCSAATLGTLNRGPSRRGPSVSGRASKGAARWSTCCARSARNSSHSTSIVLPVAADGLLCRRGTMLPLYCSISAAGLSAP